MKIINASEIEAKIKLYKDLLIKWNKSINLFSRKLEEFELDRHITDCAFLSESLKDQSDKTILDFGSGNGMPGIVLGIYGFKCILVERSKKKCSFLREASRILDIETIVIDSDINLVFDYIRELGPKIIVSKAVALAKDILDICSPIITKDTIIYLLKNQSSADELVSAKERYKFASQMIENKNLSGKVIMKIFAVDKRQ